MSTLEKSLEKEFQYYREHQDELVKKYNGKVLVIKDKQVIGEYENDFEAVRETSKKHKPGTFLVMKCTPGSESYTQTFHSIVAFK